MYFLVHNSEVRKLHKNENSAFGNENASHDLVNYKARNNFKNVLTKFYPKVSETSNA